MLTPREEFMGKGSSDSDEDQQPDRPTTEIEWRDAREEEPDEDTRILIINNDGDIESGKYAQDATVKDRCKVFKDGRLLREWKNVDFWAPAPTDLPAKDWTLEVLNRQLPGWEACEDGGYEWRGTFKAMWIGNFDVEIEAHPRFDTAAVIELRAGSTTIKIEEHATDTITSMEQGLSKVLWEVKKEAARLDAITKQIDT